MYPYDSGGAAPPAWFGFVSKGSHEVGGSSRTLDDHDPELEPTKDTALKPDLERVQSYLSSQGYDDCSNLLVFQAWESFYRQYSRLIRRFVAMHGLSRPDRDDCVQDVWVEMVTNLPRLHLDPNRGRFESWIFVLTRHVVADRIRRERRSAAVQLQAATEERIESREPDPSDAFRLSLLPALVEALLTELRARLTPASFDVLRMRVLEGRTVLEIATRMQISTERVRYHYRRARGEAKSLCERRIGGIWNDLDRPRPGKFLSF